jgi:hypothetical protein
MLSRSLFIVTLSSIGLLSGLAPDLSGRFERVAFSNAAYAQDFSDGDLAKFARAAFAIEIERRNIEQKISSMTGGNVPQVGCDRPGNLAKLPDNVRDVFVDFCKFSKQTIQSNDLTVGQFNAIKNNYNSNPVIKKRVDSELRRIGGGS